MRLGQLAKQIGARPGEIVAFLKSQNLPVSENSNNRLDEQQVALVLQHMPVALVEAVEQQTPPSDETPETESAEEIPAQLAEPEIPVEEVKEEEKIEVIRAPKVELSGLKVVGKIELPEIKPKAGAKPADEESPPETGKSRTRYPDKRQNQRPQKNPIALQRERETREAEAKRKAEEEREKEKRKQYYHNRLKTNVPVKPVKKVQKSTPQEELRPEETPKTWLGRLWKWYRS